CPDSKRAGSCNPPALQEVPPAKKGHARDERTKNAPARFRHAGTRAGRAAARAEHARPPHPCRGCPVIEHMVAVFEADAAKYGLQTRHKALLLAYANPSNKHGYCWPGTKLLMNETGMGESTLQRVKAELVDMDLIGVKPRFAADGSQISNLVRLNVERLRAMRWEGRDDTEDLIDAITFEEDGTSSQVAGG